MPNQPGDLRLANARRVLTAALHRWPCTKPELASRTGLSQMTVGKVVEQLLARELLTTAEVATHGHGRPPLHLGPNESPRFVGIELGVRETSIYRFGLAGERAPSHRTALAMPGDLESLRRQWREWQQWWQRSDTAAVNLVLVAVPGVLDTRTPAIVYSPNLHWSEGTALLEALAQDFQAQVCPVHEAQALALGHLATRASSDSFLLVDLGDGIGGTVITEGRLLGGPLPLSGEIGHTPVPGNDRHCGCGATGCVETLAGRAGLLTSFRRHSGRDQASWDTMQQALDGTRLPIWLEQTIDALATVIAGALNLLGFVEVVCVGPFTELHPDIMPRLNEQMMRKTLLGRFGRVEATAAPEHRQLGLLAAAVERVLVTEQTFRANRR